MQKIKRIFFRLLMTGFVLFLAHFVCQGSNPIPSDAFFPSSLWAQDAQEFLSRFSKKRTEPAGNQPAAPTQDLQQDFSAPSNQILPPTLQENASSSDSAVAKQPAAPQRNNQPSFFPAHESWELEEALLFQGLIDREIFSAAERLGRQYQDAFYSHWPPQDTDWLYATQMIQFLIGKGLLAPPETREETLAQIRQIFLHLARSTESVAPHSASPETDTPQPNLATELPKNHFFLGTTRNLLRLIDVLRQDPRHETLTRELFGLTENILTDVFLTNHSPVPTLLSSETALLAPSPSGLTSLQKSSDPNLAQNSLASQDLTNVSADDFSEPFLSSLHFSPLENDSLSVETNLYWNALAALFFKEKGLARSPSSENTSPLPFSQNSQTSSFRSLESSNSSENSPAAQTATAPPLSEASSVCFKKSLEFLRQIEQLGQRPDFPPSLTPLLWRSRTQQIELYLLLGDFSAAEKLTTVLRQQKEPESLRIQLTTEKLRHLLLTNQIDAAIPLLQNAPCDSDGVPFSSTVFSLKNDFFSELSPFCPTAKTNLTVHSSDATSDWIVPLLESLTARQFNSDFDIHAEYQLMVIRLSLAAFSQSSASQASSSPTPSPFLTLAQKMTSELTAFPNPYWHNNASLLLSTQAKEIGQFEILEAAAQKAFFENRPDEALALYDQAVQSARDAQNSAQTFRLAATATSILQQIVQQSASETPSTPLNNNESGNSNSNNVSNKSPSGNNASPILQQKQEMMRRCLNLAVEFPEEPLAVSMNLLALTHAADLWQQGHLSYEQYKKLRNEFSVRFPDFDGQNSFLLKSAQLFLEQQDFDAFWTTLAQISPQSKEAGQVLEKVREGEALQRSLTNDPQDQAILLTRTISWLLNRVTGKNSSGPLTEQFQRTEEHWATASILEPPTDLETFLLAVEVLLQLQSLAVDSPLAEKTSSDSSPVQNSLNNAPLTGVSLSTSQEIGEAQEFQELLKNLGTFLERVLSEFDAQAATTASLSDASPASSPLPPNSPSSPSSAQSSPSLTVSQTSRTREEELATLQMSVQTLLLCLFIQTDQWDGVTNQLDVLLQSQTDFSLSWALLDTLFSQTEKMPTSTQKKMAQLCLSKIEERLRVFDETQKTQVVPSSPPPDSAFLAEQRLLQRYQARSFDLLGEPQKALNLYAQLLGQDKNDPLVLEAIARLLWRQPERSTVEKALTFWTRLAEISEEGSPSWWRAKEATLEIYLQLEKKESAKKLLKILELTHPNFDSVSRKIRFEQLKKRL